ncbi:Polycystin cation channel [Novymonas esmeraldas]|uniref:Polycystin cation channel n=1 Tax=Novymonas esmeraldas TaxID=1808958 RepID=A0AAW0ENI6_9TRYP
MEELPSSSSGLAGPRSRAAPLARVEPPPNRRDACGGRSPLAAVPLSAMAYGARRHAAAHTASGAPATAPHQPGWRARLWACLFPSEDAVGVEGALAHHRGSASADPAASPWRYAHLPLSQVVMCLRHEQRVADRMQQCCWYMPFCVLVVVFVFLGPAAARAHLALDVDAIHLVSEAQAPLVPQLQADILLNAFRIDTEATTAADTPTTVGAFAAGNSVRYPWTYSWYNDSINAWTPQPNASLAVDAQVARVAASYHAPTYMRLSAVRTRRDMLRWLQLQLRPRLWDCKNPNYRRQWRGTTTSSHYLVGAVRVVSRRREPQPNAGVAVTPRLTDRRAAPPSIPSRLCVSEASRVAKAASFDFDAEAGGYTVLLPFATSCAAVSAVLNRMETPKRRVPWPVSFRESSTMRDLWMRYTETSVDARDDVGNDTAAAAASCASFLFHPAVSEVLVQYALYRSNANHYTVVEVEFEMASAGAVVRPQLRTFSLQVLQWPNTFASLAVSIALALAAVLYGHQLTMRMIEQVRARQRRTPRLRRTTPRQLWCVLAVLLHPKNLTHIAALVLAAATVTTWWHTLASLAAVPPATFAERVHYPSSLDAVVRTRGPLLQGLSSATILFTCLGAVRFVCVTPGMWVAFHTLVRSLQRLSIMVGVWLLINTGTAMAGVLLYGSTLSEFCTFGAAYTTLIYTLLDGGRSLLNGDVVLRQTGEYSTMFFDDSLASVRGSSIRRSEPVTLDYRAATLATASPTATPFFLLYIFYVQGLFGAVWCTITVIEAYRSVMLSAEAAALPLWHVSWARLAAYVAHATTGEYAAEVCRRALLARGEAAMLADVESCLLLGCARSSAPAAAATTPPPQQQQQQQPSRHTATHRGADDPSVSLTMVLWLLPRELQLEYGAAHLRHWWYTCVAAVVEAQRSQTPWMAAQWQQHWEQQPDSLTCWLSASVPRDSTVDERAARVGARLEDVPHSIVKYVEGRFM